MRLLSGIVALSAILSSSCNVLAISKITRQGKYLYTSDGSRFNIKGIAYQQQGEVVSSADNPFAEPSTFIDSLADGDGCKRDLPYLTQLKVNTVRVYSVDATLNHDACMQAFSNAGIYAIIDLATPLNGSIDRQSPSWTTNLLDSYLATIDTFSKYDNVLAYNVGNEVVISSGINVSPFIKAAVRDVKAYLQSKSSPALVGYASIDGDPNFRNTLADYSSCDPSGKNSGSTSIDIYGLNNYEWCGSSTFQKSYAATTNSFASYNVVTYFSEFGCITSPPRLWTEVDALFGSSMSPVWSGGVAFSYFPAKSAQGQFGMVNLSPDGKTVTTNSDFTKLATQYSQVKLSNSPSQTSAAVATFPSCSAQTNTFPASTALPPTPNKPACNCVENDLSCRFTPHPTNDIVVVGELINVSCGLLGQKGGTCDDIGGNGGTGVYGLLEGCDPHIKLSYVMTKWYQLNNNNPSACSFGGNGTVNSTPSTPSAASAVASSCFASVSATSVPSSPTPTGKPGSK